MAGQMEESHHIELAFSPVPMQSKNCKEELFRDNKVNAKISKLLNATKVAKETQVSDDDSDDTDPTFKPPQKASQRQR